MLARHVSSYTASEVCDSHLSVTVILSKEIKYHGVQHATHMYKDYNFCKMNFITHLNQKYK